MRVYVETNFLVELVLEQDEQQACEQILMHAEGGDIELAIPAPALLEAEEAVRGRIAKWKDERVLTALREMDRTASLTQDVAPLRGRLLDLAASFTTRSATYRARMLRQCRIMVLDASTLAAAEAWIAFGLKLSDATMLASVLSDATATQPSCFLNRNHKDFDDPDVKQRLSEKECVLKNSFTSGLAFIRSVSAGPRLARAPRRVPPVRSPRLGQPGFARSHHVSSVSLRRAAAGRRGRAHGPRRSGVAGNGRDRPPAVG